MDDQRIFRAFLRYRSYVGKRLGPFLWGLSDLEGEIVSLLRDIAPVANSITKHTFNVEGTFDCHVPSAFHAAVLLLEIQERCIHSDAETLEGRDLPAGPLVFRGLPDATYDLTTTLARRYGAKAPPAPEAVVFAKAMGEFGKLCLQESLPPECYMAVSQHYGLPTALLDFSPDPEVAIQFATRVGSTTEAVVYFAPLRRLMKLGATVLLPPPLFDRIYLQRGIFLKVDEAVPKTVFNTVRFPSNCEFPIYRAGEPVQILPEPEWIANVRDFVLRNPQLDSNLNEERVIDLWFRSDPPNTERLHPKFDAITQLPAWVDFFEDMRYWLACTMATKQECFAQDLLSAIESSNPELVKLHREISAQLEKPY